MSGISAQSLSLKAKESASVTMGSIPNIPAPAPHLIACCLGRVLINPVLRPARVEVRFTPKATQLLRGSEMTRWAKSCREQVQQNAHAADNV
jgi:hypothetical protein